MLAFGGHKGSALSAMIELLAGPLIGDLTSAESMAFDDDAKVTPFHGELIIALDPASFMGQAALDNLKRGEALFDAIEGQGARLPSARRYRARARNTKAGVMPVRSNVLDELRLRAAASSPKSN
jgi:delta1-piperideine-2-carboxylate reductase